MVTLVTANNALQPSLTMPLNTRMKAEKAQVVLYTDACLKPTTGVEVEADMGERWPAIIIGNLSGGDEGTLLAAEEAKSKS